MSAINHRGVYFARVRVRGKLFRKSLETNVISVGKLRLADLIKEKRAELGDDSLTLSGRMNVGDAVSVFLQRLEAQQNIKDGAKVYRRKCVEALLKTWPDLHAKPVGSIGKDDCLKWARKFAAMYSPSVYNNTVGTLRMILDIAIEKGWRAFNPANIITKRRIQFRELQLPEPRQFEPFVNAISNAGGWCSREPPVTDEQRDHDGCDHRPCLTLPLGKCVEPGTALRQDTENEQR